MAEAEAPVSIEVPTKKLKRIDALNDYIALLVKPASENIELTAEQKDKFTNEGIAIGIGPDVNKPSQFGEGNASDIQLGDRLVVRANTYKQITPETGCYADQAIVMVHKADLVLRHSKAKDGEFEFTDTWSEEDTEAVRSQVK